MDSMRWSVHPRSTPAHRCAAPERSRPFDESPAGSPRADDVHQCVSRVLPGILPPVDSFHANQRAPMTSHVVAPETGSRQQRVAQSPTVPGTPSQSHALAIRAATQDESVSLRVEFLRYIRVRHRPTPSSAYFFPHRYIRPGHELRPD